MISALDAAVYALRSFMEDRVTFSPCLIGEALEANRLLWEQGVPSPKDLTYRGAAVFSIYRKERYLLARSWAPGPTMTFGMLNPSKAGAHEDDNTIRRCVGFARREGCGGLVVVNTRALIATNPKDLAGYRDLPINGTFVEVALRYAAAADPRGPVVAAWGGNIDCDDALAADFLGRAARHWLEVLCLGKCANGTPKHPLRLAKDTPLVRYTP